MKKLALYVSLFLCTIVVFGQQQNITNNVQAKSLIEKVVSKTGNYDLLKKLRNVEYDYTFYSPNANKKDISIERYIFDGEVSWANYTTHQVFVFPNNTKDVTQFYDGENEAKVTLGDEAVEEEKALKDATFLRRANFYWFTMMPKLLDEGIVYEKLPNRTHNSIEYYTVKIGFNDGVGNVQDDYLLYINPNTFLVDRFIFTVKESSGLGIMLMEIRYETVDGYTFMAERKVISGANWDGTTTGDVLFEQTSTNVRFNNSFTEDTLAKL